MVLIIKSKQSISCILIFAFLFAYHSSAYAIGRPVSSAQACVLVHESGRILFGKNETQQLPMASVTKIMTALVCIENCSLDETVDVKPEYCAVEGSSMYLRAGKRYTVRELLTGLLLASGNDAAVCLAEHVSGSISGFAELMNKKAQELGLTDTHFVNPHGLDDDDHYSTAEDLARLMFACMENEEFRAICGTYETQIQGQYLTNHNRLLKICRGCIGGKTGYTMRAGRCLVSCAQRAGESYVCVTLNDPDDWMEHIYLYDWAENNYVMSDLSGLCRTTIPLVSGNTALVSVSPDERICYLLRKDEKPYAEFELPRFVFAPVYAGEKAGVVRICIDKDEICTADVYYCETAELAASM